MADTKEKNSRLRTFFKGVKAEFSKIKWPTRERLLKQLIAVLVVTVIVGLVIVLVDFGSQKLLDLLLNLGQ